METNELSTVRELATHAADIKHLQEDMDRLVKDMEEIKKCLGKIQSTLSEAKGGWKTLMMIGGAGGALGVMLTQLFQGYWSK
jgi:prefoldin subunit 5